MQRPAAAAVKPETIDYAAAVCQLSLVLSCAARRHVYSCLDLDAGLICSNRHNILLLKATTGIKCSSYSQLLDLSLLIIFHSAYDRLP